MVQICHIIINIKPLTNNKAISNPVLHPANISEATKIKSSRGQRSKKLKQNKRQRIQVDKKSWGGHRQFKEQFVSSFKS